MTPFTDKDLLRLRTEYSELPVEKIEALIARLQASEACINAALAFNGKIFTYKAEYRAWLKSKGEEAGK